MEPLCQVQIESLYNLVKVETGDLPAARQRLSEQVAA
jgi:hypothetical protein